jgi:hypothetical protein
MAVQGGALYESGMIQWFNDENLVDWISTMFPKLLDIFKAAETI